MTRTKQAILARTVSEMSLSDVVQAVDSLESQLDNWKPFRIAFLRNVTIDPVVPYIQFLCYQLGLQASVYMGQFDNAIQEAMDDESALYAHAPDLVVVCLKIEGLAERLVTSFPGLTAEEIKIEVGSVLDYVDGLISAMRQRLSVPILVHNFEIPAYPSFGILDWQDPAKQANTFRKLNSELLSLVRSYDNAYVVDIDLLQSEAGYARFFDHRYWHIGRAPYTREAYKLLAHQYAKFIRAINGGTKKCLVLDCDNTLWYGILGEDGINHIQLGRTYPGSAFREFQLEILNLYHRGALLALCSKNDEANVLQVLREHPDSVLREEHFVAMKINWSDKASNLQAIAEELNIGLDSLVFVDDSEFEVNLVKATLPMVEAIQLPKDPCLYRDVLRSCGLFDSLVFSKEDRNRTAMYRAEAQRQNDMRQLHSMGLDDYLKQLDMEVFIEEANDFNIPRISQLTQRTNQFNLTTIRYSESEIADLCSFSSAEVRCISLRDRFGDAGIVGVIVLRFDNGSAIIDTLLLSCRVLGRGIEDVLLAHAALRAERRGCTNLIGRYQPTAKNAQVAQLYSVRGFRVTKTSPSAMEYSLPVQRNGLTFPTWFKDVHHDAQPPGDEH